MASFRQRLIELSPFLSNQKEKIGGLTVKKSTISGSAFKKGTSQESLGEVAGKESNIGKLSRILRDTRGKTLVNEKKITLLKKISNLRKDNQQEKVNSPLLESLQAIAATTDSIRNTLIQQQDNDKSIAEQMRRDKEEQERKDQEKSLERPKVFQKLADPVIKPVMSLWGKIWKFISTIFLGKILMNFLDWFGNPENQGKITTLIRFVKDWWPALVGAVLLFGTGFGGLVTGLTVAIATFIPKMLAAITALKASKLGGKAGLIKGGLLVGGGMLAGMGISKMMDKGEGEDVSKEKVQGLNKGGQVAGSGNTDTVPAMLTPGEFVMSKGAVQKYGVDTMESMNAAAGGTNRPTLMGGFNEGGKVQTLSEKLGHTRGVITDPEEIKQEKEYMLKFVNEERALQGLEPLKKITMAPGVEMTKMLGPGPRTMENISTEDDIIGGTRTTARSKTVEGHGTKLSGEISQLTDEDKAKFYAENPYMKTLVNIKDQVELDNLGADISASAKMNGGGLVQGFKGGGLVTLPKGKINSYQDAIDAGIQVEDIVTGTGRFGSIWWKESGYRKGLKKAVKIRGTKWNLSGTGGAIDKELAMSTRDFVNMKMGWVGASSAKVESIKPKNSSKSGGSSGILGPISSNIDAMVNTDKYEVKPKEKKNVVVAYEQEATKSKSQPENQPPPGGNDIPSFDVRPPFMTDESKMQVLGMMS